MKITILCPQVIHELGNRSNQEDSVFPKLNEATLEDRVFVLCDGMGGHENGEVASQLVCDVLPEYIKKHWDGGQFFDGIFQDALDEVYNRINEYQSDSLRRMGTTLTLLCIHKGGVTMAHIGDSRIYHIRPSEHLILYKSRDHSLAYDMFMAGEIRYEDLATHKKNVITRAVMPGRDTPFKADIAHTTDVKSGDYFMLCSDGMLEQMTDGELTDLLSSDWSDEEKREQLIEKTKDNQDNHSAIIIQISDVEAEKGDELLVDDESQASSNAILLERQIREKQLSNKCESEVRPKQNPILKAVMSFINRILVFLVLILPHIFLLNKCGWLPYILLTVILTLSVCPDSNAQNTMRINYKDGSVYDVPIERIDSITFVNGGDAFVSDDNVNTDGIGLSGSWLWGDTKAGYYELLTFNEDKTYTGYDNYFTYGFETMTYGWYAQIGSMLTLQSNGYGYNRRYNWLVTALTDYALDVMTKMGRFVYYRLQQEVFSLRVGEESYACNGQDYYVFTDGARVTDIDGKLRGISEGTTYVLKYNAASGLVKAYKVIVKQ